jgi:NADH dehydrogenase
LAEKATLAGQPELPLNFVIVGAGPTGVELAGTLAEIAKNVLRREFVSINPARTRIILLEGGPRVLPSYAPDLSESAVRQLERLGVQVRTSALVTSIEAGAVWVGSERIPATVVLWAAGVQASPLGKQLDVPLDRAGRVMVNRDSSIPGHPEVFVVGDLASLKDERGNLLPGVAPVAMQQGRAAADNIKRDLQRHPRKDFHYLDKGSLATIGRAAGIAQRGRIHISGYFAWLAWLFVHVFFLIGFRNRIIVLIQWAWSYLTYERGARLITGDTSLPGWETSEKQNSLLEQVR